MRGGGYRAACPPGSSPRCCDTVVPSLTSPRGDTTIHGFSISMFGVQVNSQRAGALHPLDPLVVYSVTAFGECETGVRKRWGLRKNGIPLDHQSSFEDSPLADGIRAWLRARHSATRRDLTKRPEKFGPGIPVANKFLMEALTTRSRDNA